MKKPVIRLTHEARSKARHPEAVLKAAEAALNAAGGGDIHFAPFKAEGRQFALSSRVIIEVDWLPNRVPHRVLRQR
jgi:hypothetical protein